MYAPAWRILFTYLLLLQHLPPSELTQSRPFTRSKDSGSPHRLRPSLWALGSLTIAKHNFCVSASSIRDRPPCSISIKSLTRVDRSFQLFNLPLICESRFDLAGFSSSSRIYIFIPGPRRHKVDTHFFLVSSHHHVSRRYYHWWNTPWSRSNSPLLTVAS